MLCNPRITAEVLEEYAAKGRRNLGKDNLDHEDCVRLGQEALSERRLYKAGVYFALADVLSQPLPEAAYYHSITQEILGMLERSVSIRPGEKATPPREEDRPPAGERARP